MKKIFTLAAAVLASFSLWAADPDFESYDWSSQAEAEAVAGNHDGIVVSYAGLGSLGNVSGHWYIPNNQNLKNSDSSWKYFGVSASSPIDSIAILYCPNGTSKTSIAWVAWGQDVTPNQYTLAHGETAGTTSSKSWDNAIWETINLSAIEAYTVYTSRSVREFREIGGSSNISNFGSGQTINILGLKVWLKETKEVAHIDTALVGAAINGEALGDTDLGLLLESRTKTVYIPSAYVSAPTVTFVEQISTYYVGETDPKVATNNIDVVATVANDVWQAQATIGGNTYTVQMAKAASVTVTYMDGETILGTETIVKGSQVAENAKYEVKPLAEFKGWYTDAALTIAADLTAAVNADMTLYGKFEKAYAQSINIEQIVMDNGKGYGIKDALTAAGYAYSNLDALDSLNNDKGAARNEPYLGLKIKKTGGYIACNVQAGQTIRVKFGYVENNVLAIIGNDTVTLTPADKTLDVLEYTATSEQFVKIQTTSDKTVVIKQIMVNEAITNVMYPITYAAAENGNLEGWTIALPGEEVKVTVTPAEGYKIATVTLDSEALTAVEGVYSFVMPAKEVNVAVTFVAEGEATAINNTEDAVKAVKFFENGQLIIMKNGVLYNAQGSVVK